ncbi:TIGR01777 family oxidoreductase [Erwinia psidii]|uniref:TIGR01777 family protein n=1 Tax=Erwinia psidii TaxID=69224 RepID=A0A3N6SQ52_9GAMM|nr:TIGR01777 family oxidoreductase [Erwinia psidii]MCX8956633.1 TIGR01777 family protein [Erwinia psidii]MCX8961457.1 TIGR01777 family protein [Erwinia psidii]MCX8965075.1 TIGR01777 family protein [Erwinia psidii]RQM39966.1 TIGR01777 family protein [Erwinia psidii]
MHILLTGGTGLIGSHLIPHLLQRGHQLSVVTRDVAGAHRKLGDNVNLWSGLDQQRDLNGIDAVINLAGEPVADKRWTEQQKKRLCHSRWHITGQLAALIKASNTPPTVFISGSATGYYGDRKDTVLTEEDTGQEEFTHRLCAEWEALALAADSEITRVCLLRTGVILAREGGALGKMKLPFQFGIGGPLGNGRQYMPWIHLDDMLGAILWLLDNPPLRGAFNMVAPGAVRNGQFAATLGRAMHRPAFVRTPASAIKLMMGESSVLLLGGQHVRPKRLEESGFIFRWPELESALRDVV